MKALRPLWPALAACVFLGCGTSAAVDQTTETYAATVGKTCSTNHDCAGNQRCVAKVCELDKGACIDRDQCGSARCDGGFCGPPSPALLFDTSKNNTPAPRHYLRVGNDGLVDGRGGMVLGLFDTLRSEGDAILWHDFALRNWRAHSTPYTTWAPTITDSKQNPERFIFEHQENGSLLVAYVRPLDREDLSSKTEPLVTHAARLAGALERGHGLDTAVGLDPTSVTPVTLERVRMQADRLEQLKAIRYEGVRPGDQTYRFRVYISRLEFGTEHFTVYVGLYAPNDFYTEMLDELADFAKTVSFGGIDAGVDIGVE